MGELDASYWTQRYKQGETGWDVGEITTPLKTYFDQLTDKTISILIPGAGNAYEAQYLLDRGFTSVTVCDLSEVPLNKLRARNSGNASLTVIQGDFFTITGKFDLIIEQTFFCAIHPALREKYFEKVVALLKEGGRLVGVLFDDPLNEHKPPFGGNKQEYLEYIPSTLHVKRMDKCYNSIVPRAGRELFINIEKRRKVQHPLQNM